MDKTKIFNDRSDKIMKKAALVSIVLGVISLVLISVLAILTYRVS